MACCLEVSLVGKSPENLVKFSFGDARPDAEGFFVDGRPRLGEVRARMLRKGEEEKLLLGFQTLLICNRSEFFSSHLLAPSSG